SKDISFAEPCLPLHKKETKIVRRLRQPRGGHFESVPRSSRCEQFFREIGFRLRSSTVPKTQEPRIEARGRGDAFHFLHDAILAKERAGSHVKFQNRVKSSICAGFVEVRVGKWWGGCGVAPILGAFKRVAERCLIGDLGFLRSFDYGALMFRQRF